MVLVLAGNDALRTVKLATAQRFVTAHGGQISAARSDLGGARFVIELPLRAVRSAEAAA